MKELCILRYAQKSLAVCLIQNDWILRDCDTGVVLAKCGVLALLLRFAATFGSAMAFAKTTETLALFVKRAWEGI